MSASTNKASRAGDLSAHSPGKLVITLALFLSLALSPVTSYSQDEEPELPPQEQAKEHFNRALELKDESDSDPLKETEMLAEYDLCLKYDPNFVDAYTNLGVHHFIKKNYSLAEKNFKSALEIDATDTTVYDNLGKIYTILHKYEEAQSAFEGGVSANPAYAGGQKEIGKLLYKQRKYADALTWLEKYNSLVTDDYYSHYLAGKSYKNLNDIEKALEEFRKTLELKKNYANAYNAIGRIYLAQEQFPEAIAAYRESVKYNSKGYRAYFNLAIAIQRSNPDDLDGNLAIWKQAQKVAKMHPKGEMLLENINNQIIELEKRKSIREAGN